MPQIPSESHKKALWREEEGEARRGRGFWRVARYTSTGALTQAVTASCDSFAAMDLNVAVPLWILVYILPKLRRKWFPVVVRGRGGSAVCIKNLISRVG